MLPGYFIEVLIMALPGYRDFFLTLHIRLQDMDFFDENIGYAVGWGGKAYRSDDGGATWQVLPTPNTDDQLTDIYLVGPNELWVSTN